MRFAQLFMLTVVLVVAMGHLGEDLGSDERCTCAVFGQKGEEKITGEPLLTKEVTLRGTCDQFGAAKCGRLCKGMAEAAVLKGSQEFCEVLYYTEKPLRPTIYSKFCEEEMWTYTGLTATRDYCCVGGKRWACLEATE